jgi:hypothetical protein
MVDGLVVLTLALVSALVVLGVLVLLRVRVLSCSLAVLVVAGPRADAFSGA